MRLPHSSRPRAHRTRARLGEELRAVPGMTIAVARPGSASRRLADQLLAAVAEQPLGCGVRELDLAGAIDDHHRVRRGLEHRLRVLQIAPSSSASRCSSVMSLDINRNPIGSPSPPRRGVITTRAVNAVPSLRTRSTVPCHSSTRPRYPHHRLRQPVSRVLVGVQHRLRLADDLGGRVAVQPPRAFVPQLDHTVDVGGDDRILGRGLEHARDELCRCVASANAPSAISSGMSDTPWPSASSPWKAGLSGPTATRDHPQD